jgi:tetratricopeptide (TPR) repeat protein
MKPAPSNLPDRSDQERVEELPPLSGLIETSSFVRQLVHERYFRVAAALVILALLIVGVSLPPILQTSPKDFRPVIRVSLLAKLESVNLARAARRLDQEGKTEEAIVTWRQALFKNLADHDHQVGLLRTLIGQPVPSIKWLGLGVGQAMWTLRMFDGSVEDRLVAAELFAKYNIQEYVWQSLKPMETNLNDFHAALYLKSCFHTRHFAELGAGLERFPKVLEIDPEMPVFASAWAAAWGPPSGSARARRDLAAARTNRTTAVTANRLQLVVSEAEYDWPTFSQAMKALRDFNADRPMDHVAEWRLLELVGRADDAREQARTYSTPPTQPFELRAMFDGLMRLNLKEYAAEFMKKHLPALGTERELWPLQANLLMQLGQWDDVRVLAIDLRTTHSDLELVGYAWFLEGLVQLHNHLPEQAAYAFSRVPERPIGIPLLGFHVGRRLAQLGFPKLAEKTVANLEQAAGKTADYWYNVTLAALSSGDFEIAANAAAKAYELQPDHPATRMNYAAALLTLRTNSSLAAKLTLQLHRDNPNSAGNALNYALALLQNDRLSDAETLLNEIPVDQLDGPTSTTFAVAMFELRYHQQRQKEAMEAYQKIQFRFLQAPQSNWVESVHRKLAAPGRTGS